MHLVGDASEVPAPADGTGDLGDDPAVSVTCAAEYVSRFPLGWRVALKSNEGLEECVVRSFALRFTGDSQLPIG